MDHLNRATHDGYHHSHLHKCQQALNLERAKKKKNQHFEAFKGNEIEYELGQDGPS